MGFAIVTLMGHNRAYEHVHDTDIFDGINLPEGIDKDTLVRRIFWRCGEFSIGHTDPDFLHYDILQFFDTHYRTFEKMLELSEYEYNPGENYDRSETWRDDGTYQDNRTNSDSGSSSNSNTNTTTNLHTTTTNNNETKRAAFNENGSTSYTPYEKEEGSGSSTTNGTVTDSGTASYSNSGRGNENGTNANVHTGRVHGNIGVRSTQELLEQSYDLEPKLNVITYIANLFCEEFCIQVY